MNSQRCVEKNNGLVKTINIIDALATIVNPNFVKSSAMSN